MLVNQLYLNNLVNRYLLSSFDCLLWGFTVLKLSIKMMLHILMYIVYDRTDIEKEGIIWVSTT